MRAKLDTPAGPLHNTTASSAPRSGEVGVLPVDELPDDITYVTGLAIAVHCPNCTSYGLVEGDGGDYRNITKMLAPTFRCSFCSWRPSTDAESPRQWKAWYQGRLGGTMFWAVNEEHLEVLSEFLETSPKRRKRVEFGWEYRSLMKRLPLEATSNRNRNDMVSLVKKLQHTRPRGI